MTDRLDTSLTVLLAERFGLRIAEAEPVLGLGDECEIWRTATPGGFAHRIGPAFRSVSDLQASAPGRPVRNRSLRWPGQATRR